MCVPVDLAEGDVKFGVFLGAGHDELAATVVEREIADEDTTIVQVLRTVHPAREPEYGEWEYGGTRV